MKILKKLNFKKKLILSYGLLIVIPFIISSHALSTMSTANIQENTTKYIHMFTDQITSNLDSYISELDRMTKTALLDDTLCDILSSPPPGTAVEAYRTSIFISQYILKLTTQQPNIQNIILLGREQTAYTDTGHSLPDIMAYEETVHFDQLNLENRRLGITTAHSPNYLIANFANDTVFSVVRRLYSLNNEYIGMVILNIKCSDLLNAININNSLIDSGARIVITNKDNWIIADTSDDFNASNLSDEEYMLFDSTESNDERHVTITSTSDYSGLNTTVIIDREELYYSSYTFRNISSILIGCLIGLLLSFSIYFTYRLLKPLRVLQNAMDEVRAGNYEITVKAESADEFGALAASFNHMLSKICDLMQHVYVYEIQNRQAQLEALQNQINPHFLHNTLETIRMKALLNSDKEVADMIKNLAKLFRITLDRTQNTVTIQDELSHVETYLKIQNMRSNNRYRLICHVPEIYLNKSIIKLCLQPLVENSITHGFKKTFGDETIWIHVKSDTNGLLISISDNGTGISLEKLKYLNARITHEESASMLSEAHNSIGIVNIADRIRLQYGEGHYLKIVNAEPRGTTVWLHIPDKEFLQENQEDSNV